VYGVVCRRWVAGEITPVVRRCSYSGGIGDAPWDGTVAMGELGTCGFDSRPRHEKKNFKERIRE